MRPDEVLVLAGRDDVANDLRDLHQFMVMVVQGSLSSIVVDDADDGGIDRAILEAGRHARGAAADDEHGFADARIDGVDGHEIAAFGLAARIHRPRDEQLAADQPWILAGRDHGPHDLRQEHSALLCQVHASPS